MDVARALDPADVELTFLEHTPEECHFDAEIRRLGHRVVVCPSPHSPVGYAVRLRRILRRRDPSTPSTPSSAPSPRFRCPSPAPPGAGPGGPQPDRPPLGDRRCRPARRAYARAASAVLVRAMTAGVACSEEASLFLSAVPPSERPRGSGSCPTASTSPASARPRRAPHRARAPRGDAPRGSRGPLRPGQEPPAPRRRRAGVGGAGDAVAPRPRRRRTRPAGIASAVTRAALTAGSR